ncbi:MAG: sigma-70 family RNA polymerase sigma factor [Candidatus Sumerlaeia bacterium]|nr:sigma-70 family RNA polymerase sigma factor [Candidatus Sumerlaeia bacterium]
MSDWTLGKAEPSAEEEEILITKAQQGDERALETLLAHQQDRVYRTALKFMSGREEEAFELAQEVLISAFRHIGKFKRQSRFSTWLYRITSNLAKNRYVVENRERSRFSSLDGMMEDDDDRPRQWADSGIDPRSAASGHEEMAAFHACLEELDPEWKEILILRFVEDQSYEELSEILQIPIGTVKSRLNRARKALRDLMKPEMKGELS